MAFTRVLHTSCDFDPLAQWAVRQGDWKLIGNPRDTSNKATIAKCALDDRRFLVNLSEDVSEMKNLAAEHPDIVQRLEKLHDRWLVDVSKQ